MMNSLQAELEQVIDRYHFEWQSNNHNAQTEAVKAILATVSKHLPEKVEAPLDCCDNEGGAICWKETKVNARNTAITEMEKLLGGSV